MLDREDGVKIVRRRGIETKIDRLGREIRKIQSSGHVLANVGNAVSSRPSLHGKADGRMGFWDAVTGV